MKEVLEKLIEVLTEQPQAKDDLTIISFLSDLFEEKSITAYRLICCMSIDCFNSLKVFGTSEIPQNTYILNLRKIILNAANSKITLKSVKKKVTPRWKFAHIQSNTPFADKIPSISSDNNDTYFRVTSFSSYLKWVIGINKEFNLGVDIPDGDPDEVLRLYNDFLNKDKFKKCKITRLGYNRFVFVGDFLEVKKIGFQNADKIIDSLGLYVHDISKNHFYICLKYDDKFDLTSWQPDAMTGDWGHIYNKLLQEGNDFYLSYFIKDGFGRTYSVTGNGDQLKEKVHLPFDEDGKRTFEMEAINLGALSGNLNKGTDKAILEEAKRRYKKSV